MTPQQIVLFCIGAYFLILFGIYYYLEKTIPDKGEYTDNCNIISAAMWPLWVILKITEILSLIIQFPFKLLSELAKK